eukprot:gnl/TRDRNA2_/TRDRNA2_163678_c1_seq1.p1 gnl/TRDRNA2_/TRDRNA2_163678_c1~~gnl/TRDRNA2_/TRDRNA2_163678_c1_seq1.p1  ORF type:complete len:100 (+),score=10.92 gnl/TRDRNA2_/TRDRNA2_163678_c1_seq1:32-301(+)
MGYVHCKSCSCTKWKVNPVHGYKPHAGHSTKALNVDEDRVVATFERPNSQTKQKEPIFVDVDSGNDTALIMCVSTLIAMQCEDEQRGWW